MRAAVLVMLAAGTAAAQPRATGPIEPGDPPPTETVELPVSGLRVQLPAGGYRVSRAFVPELDGDADIITPRRDAGLSVRVTVRELTCNAMRATAIGIMPALHGLRELREQSTDPLDLFETPSLGDSDPPHHLFQCANLGSRAAMVEIVEPSAGPWAEVVRPIAVALKASGSGGILADDATNLLIPTRLFVGGSYARTRPETTIGGRLGFEAFAGRDHGTGLASGLGGAFGLDGDLHATYELHLKAGVAHVFASRTALYVTARGGFQRSWPDGDAKFGWYAGGEADLHLPYLDVAGGATTRGQFARLAVIRFHYDPTQPRATQIGASAGLEWIHDGQVQMVSLYLAMAD